MKKTPEIKMPDGPLERGSEIFVDKNHTIEIIWNKFYHYLACSCGWSSYPEPGDHGHARCHAGFQAETRRSFWFYWLDLPLKSVVRKVILKHLKDKKHLKPNGPRSKA